MSSSGAGTAPWRQSLGRVGVWVGAGAVGQDPGGFAARVERLGYGAVWVGGGNPDGHAFDLLERTLSQTRRLVVATGITNIWAWEPAALARRVTVLGAAYPGRFVLGLGVSHAPLVEGLGHRYEHPLKAMADFLGGLDAAEESEADGRDERPRPRVLAALGQQMLELSRDRSAGAHPYLTPPEHTELARHVLGEAPLLAPEQAFVLEDEPRRHGPQQGPISRATCACPTTGRTSSASVIARRTWPSRGATGSSTPSSSTGAPNKS
jgi:probable F420-dependent oxidoreductase